MSAVVVVGRQLRVVRSLNRRILKLKRLDCSVMLLVNVVYMVLRWNMMWPAMRMIRQVRLLRMGLCGCCNGCCVCVGAIVVADVGVAAIVAAVVVAAAAIADCVRRLVGHVNTPQLA